jgi:hypothetical protein
MNIFKGSVFTVSPAFGTYRIDLYELIDPVHGVSLFTANGLITGIAVTGSL